MNQKEFKEFIDSLSNNWMDDGGYNKYSSILEFLDNCGFDRKFYLSIDPNSLIHEYMREELASDGENTSRMLVISGIMECYDFCQQTKDMSKDEAKCFENFKD